MILEFASALRLAADEVTGIVTFDGTSDFNELTSVSLEKFSQDFTQVVILRGADGINFVCPLCGQLPWV